MASYYRSPKYDRLFPVSYDPPLFRVSFTKPFTFTSWVHRLPEYYSSTPCASSDVPNLYVEAPTLLHHTLENLDEVVPLHAMRKYEGGKI